MGKPKTQRTEQLRQAAQRLVIVEEVSNTLEQHNFDRLVAQGTIVEGQAPENALKKEHAWAGGREAKPPKGAGVALSTT